MSEAVIKATYVTYKPVPTRKVLQLVFEVPLETAQMAHQTLGQPMPDTETWVAIARLQEPSAKAEKPKRNWSELSRAEQAGIACEDRKFWEYLSLLGKPGELSHTVKDSEHAARVVRYQCKVTTRANLDHGQMAAELWDALYSDYQRWKMGAAA